MPVSLVILVWLLTSFLHYNCNHILYTGNIYAIGNYWLGGASVNSSRIITSPTLNFDPYTSVSPGDDYGTEIESELLLKRGDEPIEKVPGIEEIDEAARLLYSKKYEEAFVDMHRLGDKYKYSFVGKRALVFIENILT